MLFSVSYGGWFKVDPYQVEVGAHDSIYRGELNPVTHLFSAIYKGPITYP